MSGLPRGLPLLAAALVASGCTTVAQCTIPDAPLTAPPGPPVPARVGIHYADGLDLDSLELPVGQSSYRFPVGPAAVSAVNRAAPQLFTGLVHSVSEFPVEGGPEGVLAVRLDAVKLTPGPLRAEAAEVRVSALLRDRKGQVARAGASATAEGESIHYAGPLHCDSAGAALGAALATAVGRVRDELLASPAVAAWAADPGREVVAPEATPAAPGGPTGPAGGQAPPAPALPTPEQPSASEQHFRPAPVPRFIEVSLAHGDGWSDTPGASHVSGWGWGLRMAWDIGEYVALGFQAQDSYVRVDWTPNPGQATDTAEHGVVGAELMLRLRPGRTVRPWLAATLAFPMVTWDHYFHSVGGFGLLGSAGLDVATGSFGWVRLGLGYTSVSAQVTSGYGQQGPTPAPGDDGTSARLRALWLTMGWVLDLGPAR